MAETAPVQYMFGVSPTMTMHPTPESPPAGVFIEVSVEWSPEDQPVSEVITAIEQWLRIMAMRSVEKVLANPENLTELHDMIEFAELLADYS